MPAPSNTCIWRRTQGREFVRILFKMQSFAPGRHTNNQEHYLPTPPNMTCVEDFRQLALRRVRRMFYDYADSRSWTESTYRANEDDLHKLKFRQRVAVDIEKRTHRPTML